MTNSAGGVGGTPPTALLFSKNQMPAIGTITMTESNSKSGNNIASNRASPSPYNRPAEWRIWEMEITPRIVVPTGAAAPQTRAMATMIAAITPSVCRSGDAGSVVGSGGAVATTTATIAARNSVAHTAPTMARRENRGHVADSPAAGARRFGGRMSWSGVIPFCLAQAVEQRNSRCFLRQLGMRAMWIRSGGTTKRRTTPTETPARLRAKAMTTGSTSVTAATNQYNAPHKAAALLSAAVVCAANLSRRWRVKGKP